MSHITTIVDYVMEYKIRDMNDFLIFLINNFFVLFCSESKLSMMLTMNML